MKIYAKTKQHFDGKEEYYNRLPLPSQVKRLGKYLKDNLSGVYKVVEPPNEYIIYDTLLYQVPADLRRQMREYDDKFHGAEEEIWDVNVYFNITTYGEYIRVNIILLDKNEVTLGYMRLDHKDLMSLPACKKKILDYTYKQITRYFKKYEVLI